MPELDILMEGKVESFKREKLAKLSSIIPASDQMAAFFDEVYRDGIELSDLDNVPEALFRFDQATAQSLHDFGATGVHEATVWASKLENW